MSRDKLRGLYANSGSVVQVIINEAIGSLSSTTCFRFEGDSLAPKLTILILVVLLHLVKCIVEGH